MIVTDLEHLEEQAVLTPAMRRAAAFLQQAHGHDLPDGRIEIDGNRVYALVQSYVTLTPAADVTFEGHRAYIDVQYVAAGEELIGWVSADRVQVTKPYDATGDAWLGALPADETTLVHLWPGDLAILYPIDAHAPRLAAGAPAPVKKIVVKVAVGA
ncbi:MAG: YhcH/YjgK/YiaL family protein [Chloroflexi bacterium HGW-Chloroflexi-1]|nr:MAG: YhcH/YjgK/YiaL family protein [Chloroflexi bacterium HGW-Chloroflexi-1]